MKSGEITRLIFCLLIGALIVFIGQPWLYQSRIVKITDVPVNEWVSNYYIIQAGIVFAISSISVIFWFISGIKSRAETHNELKGWRSVWYTLLFFNVLSIFIAIYFNKVSDDALISTALFLLFDVIWIFWLGTAVSSPNLFMYLPPGAEKIRSVFGD